MLGAGRTRQGPPGSGPIILPPQLTPSKGCRGRFFSLANWEANHAVPVIGDWFFISAATGTLLLVEVGVLIIVGVI